MSHLVVPKVECIESGNNYGRFLAEPLEKGFGITLGNTLRRILLSQLQGAAVTRVKIEGIQHEFSTIPYVREDATEFLLNLKALRIKPVAGIPGKLALDVEGEGRITAADINPSADFEIANPDLYLATLDSAEAKLYAELDVELDSGYREAESTDNMAIGVIPVDAIFSPMKKVNYTVEPIYIGQETSRERLYLEIWTDGTITASDALSQAAELLEEQLRPFVNFSKESSKETEDEPSSLDIPEELYNMPVEQLNLSVRTMNCLRRGGIATVGELASKEEKELMALRNFGQKSNREIKERLESLGLSLASTEPENGEEEVTETDEAIIES
ncbi:MAG: DNA-directed RNA polymerase subunit alpha [Chloroflexi bacterium RBG_13_46_14]|nr:MAG: DNA-directed RNA polymerase subunit alpha [Chloroflexi bacterium RBG_13_46_14]